MYLFTDVFTVDVPPSGESMLLSNNSLREGFRESLAFLWSSLKGALLKGIGMADTFYVERDLTG